MRVLVCGGRDFNDVEFIHRTLDALSRLREFDVMIHGAAPGADSLAGAWAKHHNMPVEVYPADWQKYGKRAGPIRNAQMLREGKPDVVIAFPGGRGTAHMTMLAREAGVKVMDVSAFSTHAGDTRVG